MPITPPSFATNTAALASNIDAGLVEFEKINGELDETYLSGLNVVSKRPIRRGALTRSSRNACNKDFEYTVGTGGDDLHPLSSFFAVGGVTSLDLPAGRWLCVINTVCRGNPEKTRVMWRRSDFSLGYWSEVGVTDTTADYTHGVFMQPITLTDDSVVRFGIEVSYPTVSDFTLNRVAISVTAFRTYTP